MRTFYEEWSYLDKSEPALLDSNNGNLAPAGAELEMPNWNQLVPKQIEFPDTSFFAIGFSHHRTILSKVKDTNERIFRKRRNTAFSGITEHDILNPGVGIINLLIGSIPDRQEILDELDELL